MNKGEVLVAGLIVVSLTGAMAEIDKRHTHPNVANGKTLEYNTTTLIDMENKYREYVVKKEEERKAEEREKRRQEKLAEQQRIKEREQARKREEELKKGQRVLFEVSFYHDNLITASGVRPRLNHTIACPKEVPFGSIISFQGKQYVCEDRGGYIKKVWSDKYNDYLYRVDVFVSSEAEAYKLGRYVVEGTIKKN